MASKDLTFKFFAKDNASKTMKSLSDNGRRMGDTLGKVGVGVGIAFAAAAAGIIKAGFEAVESLKRIEVIGAQTTAVIKSTGGAANVTAEQIVKMADALELTTATESESIQEGANLLLTFTNIRNGLGKNEKVFDRATELMVDMARAMGTDAKSGAVQLGKALNDPIQGIAALSRVGVQFTDDQEKMIRSLVEAGDVLGAQQVILGELETQFGGSGESYAATMAGQVDILNHNLGGLAEGVMLSLMPALEDMVAWGNSDLIPWLGEFADWFVQDGIPAIRDFVGWVIEYKDDLFILAGAIGAATAAQWLFNIAAAANPVGIIAAAIIALGGWFVWLGQNHEMATGWVLDAAENVTVALLNAAGAMHGIASGFVNGIISMINAVMGPINAVRQALGLPASIVPAFRLDNSGLQGIINGIQDGRTLRDRTGRADSGTLGNYQRLSGGGAGGGTPGVFLASGGIVTPTPGGTRATIGEAGHPEAVIPLSASNLAKYGMGGGSVSVTINGFVGTSKDQVARELVRYIEDAKKIGSVRRGALA